MSRLTAGSVARNGRSARLWSCRHAVRAVPLFLLLGAWLALPGTAAEPWTLERALAEALRHNPDVRIAARQIAAAQAGIEQADAAVWPKLQLQSSYVRTDNPMQVFGSILNQRAYSPRLDFNDVPDMDNWNAKALVTMPLYSGGSLRATRAAARAGSAAVRADEQAIRNALAFEVSRAYFTVLKARDFIAAAEAAVKAYDENVGLARKRLAAGTILRTETLDLEVRLAQAAEDLVRAKNARAIAQRTLRNLVGVEEDITVAGPVELSIPTLAPGPAPRPELLAATERERAARDQARAMKGGFLPSVSAFGSLDNDYGTRNDEDGQSYTAGVLAQWNVWDGQLTRARVREANAELEISRETTRKIHLAIDLEVETARLEWAAAGERLKTSGQTVAHAQESAELTRSRYQQGAGLAAQLIDAETALVSARARRAEAEADRSIAIAALRKALGLAQMDPVSSTNKP